MILFLHKDNVTFKLLSFLVPIVLIVLAPFCLDVTLLQSNLPQSLLQPNLQHWFGTDGNGKDIFTQILFSARLSLSISFVVVVFCVIIGVIIGFIASYFSGLADRIFVFVADIFQAFPGILLAITIAAFIEPGVMNLILLLSFTGWVSYARVVRAQIFQLKSREFILATEALGLSHAALLFKHILPNIAGPLIVQASFGMAGVILAESSLSFLGLGLPAHVPSLGKLLDSGVNLLLIAPHVSLFPGAVIMLFVLGFNLFGDQLRKHLT